MTLSCLLTIMNSPSLDDLFKISGKQILLSFFSNSRHGDVIIEVKNPPYNARTSYVNTAHSLSKMFIR